jgi:hypothetical protein
VSRARETTIDAPNSGAPQSSIQDDDNKMATFLGHDIRGGSTADICSYSERIAARRRRVCLFDPLYLSPSNIYGRIAC